MWKRDEAERPTGSPQTGSGSVAPARRADVEPGRSLEKDVVHIGKLVAINGELHGSEDLTIEGRVEGTIELRDYVLTIGPNGRIKAQVVARSVIVLGEIVGDITASDKVSIQESGSVEGDITAPRVAIAEGAVFRGSIDMKRTRQAADEGKAAPKAPAAGAPAADSPADRAASLP